MYYETRGQGRPVVLLHGGLGTIQISFGKRISAPALLVIGDRDGIRAEHILEIYRALPHGQLLVLPDTPHDTFNNRPSLLNPALIAFLDAPAAAAR